jgi:hypothetical protein
VTRSGRGALAGGIMPVRTLRATFSHTCASWPARDDRQARRARGRRSSAARCGR